MSTRAEAINRRAVLGTTAAAALGTAVAALGRPAGASAHGRGEADLKVSGSFTVVDRRGAQRVLADTRKPPVILGGHTYPAELRQGPDDATYLIFNNDDGDERGGIIAFVQGAQVSLDYPNAQAITMLASAEGGQGSARLYMAQAPDADLPIEQVPAMPTRVDLGWDTERGSTLELNDAAGRPRIRLRVGPDDTALIQVLDQEGKVTAQLPPDPRTGQAGAAS